MTSPNSPIERVVSLLTSNSYRSLGTRLIVSSVPFEFSALLVGSDRALDLIVVIDTLVEPEARIRQKIEGLSRALDVVGSRRPLTVILVGPTVAVPMVDAISRVARVLSVGTPTESNESQLKDSLAVLLPLEVAPVPTGTIDALSEVRRLAEVELRGRKSPIVESLLTASLGGAVKVRDTLKTSLAGAFLSTDEDWLL